jgi:alpha-tubulin suppressor-like RCC1 family protein
MLVSAFGDRTCALLRDGTVRCWSADSRRPTVVRGLSAARALSVGGEQGCALDASGVVRCFGFGGALAAEAVRGLSSVVGVAVGDRHACAAEVGGAVRCWGANESGQVGDGTNEARQRPVLVRGLPGALAPRRDADASTPSTPDSDRR